MGFKGTHHQLLQDFATGGVDLDAVIQHLSEFLLDVVNLKMDIIYIYVDRMIYVYIMCIYIMIDNEHLR